jgi:hypothetical protein
MTCPARSEVAIKISEGHHFAQQRIETNIFNGCVSGSTIVCFGESSHGQIINGIPVMKNGVSLKEIQAFMDKGGWMHEIDNIYYRTVLEREDFMDADTGQFEPKVLAPGEMPLPSKSGHGAIMPKFANIGFGRWIYIGEMGDEISSHVFGVSNVLRILSEESRDGEDLRAKVRESHDWVYLQHSRVFGS